jgi:exodeoxyribonuclease-5
MEVIMLCNTIMEESAQLAKDLSKKLFEICSQDYPDAVSLGHLRRLLQKDPYYNALHMKFAYAITCHKAQGGQWPCVFIDQGYLTDEMAGLELNRWFYTALTRAQEKVYLVGFQDKLMVESERGLF